MKRRIFSKVFTVTELVFGGLMLFVLLIALIPFAYAGLLLAAFGNPIILILAVLGGTGCIVAYLVAVISTIIEAVKRRHKKKVQAVQAY